MNTEMMLPAISGLVGPLTEPSSFRIVAWPVPPVAMIPGDTSAGVNFIAFEVCPEYFTWTTELANPASSYGTTQLICVLLT
jgi:hypothetical protein